MAAWDRAGSPHTAVVAHNGSHAQPGVVLKGTIDVIVGDETRPLGPGDASRAAPTSHVTGVTAGDGCLVLGTLPPLRADDEEEKRRAQAPEACEEPVDEEGRFVARARAGRAAGRLIGKNYDLAETSEFSMNL